MTTGRKKPVASAGAVLVLGLAVCLTACAVPGIEDGGGYGYAFGDDTYVSRARRDHPRGIDGCSSCARPEHRDHREHHREPNHGAQRAHARQPEPQRHHAPEKRHDSHQGGGHHKSEKSEKKKN
jgi:hypothetical protein